MPATDPTFYRTPRAAATAAPEQLAYVAAFDPAGRVKDAIAVVDCDPGSSSYGGVVGWAELPTAGNELHHFGWNACSSALCHEGHDHHNGLERRYLLVPGIRSSTTYVLDTKPDPRNPVLKHTIEAGELAAKAGYSRPHTVHCGPGGIFMSALGGANGDDGPGGVALLDHDTFEVLGPWEEDRGPQFFAYDFWWHLQQDTVVTSEWASPSMIENGLNPEDLLGRKFGHHLNFWSMSERKLTQRIDLGDEHQMVLELRPAHDPSKSYGFASVVISVEDLSASIWLWHKDGDQWSVAQGDHHPGRAGRCRRPAADPARGSVRSRRWSPTSTCPSTTAGYTCHVGAQANSSNMTSATHSTRGRRRRSASAGSCDANLTRRFRTNHLAAARRWWRSAATAAGSMSPIRSTRRGTRFSTPTGVGSWMAKLDADVANGGLAADPSFFPHGDDFRGLRVHQTRLQGGDASSDSYCFTN